MGRLKKSRCEYCGKNFLGNEYWNHVFKCTKRKAIKKALSEHLEQLLRGLMDEQKKITTQRGNNETL